MKHTVTPTFEMKDGTTVVMDPVTYEVVLTQGTIKTVDVETYKITQERPVSKQLDGSIVTNLRFGKTSTMITLKGVRLLSTDVQQFNFNEPVEVSLTVNGTTEVFKYFMIHSYKQTSPGTLIEELVLGN